MARYTGPKDKLSRREGFDLFGKGAKLTRLAVPPGQHGPKGARRPSEYGRQLRDKQKIKRLYGILERQCKKYAALAEKMRGSAGEEFVKLLETRLDNVVYRLGFAPTRPAARQLVSHGHVFVNDKRVNIPSYSVVSGEIINISQRATQKIPSVTRVINEAIQTPSWIERKGTVGKIVRLPERSDVSEPIDEQSVIEYYSR